MNEHQEFSEEENLKNENEFLKMKLMLEQGAQFESMQTNNELPPDIENQFLRNIMEYEKQAAERKTIKVFDKIERPTHFKPVNEIAENEIKHAWNELDEYLQKYGIDLSVCSPNITDRELYRFATEELFTHEIDDMNLPGMMTCFTYDEFYPDHKYDNARYAVDDCIKPILEKDPLEWMYHFKNKNLRLNNNFPLSQDKFKDIVNRFKQAYEDILLNELSEPVCTMEEKTCYVQGNYNVTAKLPAEEIKLQGNWRVEFEFDDVLGYWDIANVQIEGINF